MTGPGPVAERLQRVRERVAAACDRGRRDPAEVELLAVTKTIPAGVIREAVDAGQRLFGESRQQEAEAKIPELPLSLCWHFIGHLQRNKVRKVLPLFETLHGVDSLRLAEHVDRTAAELGCFPKVYLEVNLAGEGSKHGFRPGQLRDELERILALPRLEVLGLMTIPPYSPDPEDSRARFRELRLLRDALASRCGVPLPALSMGMSGDFEVAIEEGATIVRVGSAIFGSRPVRG